MSFFHTTEFYVILFLVAMAIVAFLAKPHTAGPASEYLLGAALSADGGTEPAIAVDCDESGTVWLRRSGIDGVDASGAVSAKIVVKGFNITVYERITPGNYGDSPVDSALFEFDFLAAERYWLRYESEATNSSATLTFRNTPGYHAGAILKQ
ncbi:MAG: hypothetical protein K2L55_01495 [Muribaculaceae bacterium]|nr:hypothetical protein [Muribaculaceae bacterium]